jgi:predicted RNA-binding Zn-ribbon protein involved in translation (DUF1610 family)
VVVCLMIVSCIANSVTSEIVPGEFPCHRIADFPMSVGKKVILRAIPYWREVGTEKWIQDEEARYLCPECGNKVFRGVTRCNKCKVELDLD